VNAPEILIQISGPKVPLEVTVDRGARAAYVRVRFGSVSATLEHSEGVLFDVDAQGRLLGVDLLLPVSAGALREASDYYLAKEGAEADREVPPAIDDAATLLATFHERDRYTPIP